MNSIANPYIIPKQNIKKKNLITDFLKPKPIQNRKGKKMHIPIEMLPPISPIRRSHLYGSVMTAHELMEASLQDEQLLAEMQLNVPPSPPRVQRIHERVIQERVVQSPRSIIDELFYTYDNSSSTTATTSSISTESTDDIIVLDDIEIEIDEKGDYIICEGVVVGKDEMESVNTEMMD